MKSGSQHGSSYARLSVKNTGRKPEAPPCLWKGKSPNELYLALLLHGLLDCRKRGQPRLPCRLCPFLALTAVPSALVLQLFHSSLLGVVEVSVAVTYGIMRFLF